MKTHTLIAALLAAPLLLAGQDNLLDEEFASQTGTAYTIILDDSGSMQANNKFSQARKAFLEWVNSIPEGNTWSFLPLNNTQISLPFTKNGKKQAEIALLQARPRGGTPIVRNLAIALQNIRDRRKTVTPYERHVVVLLTDGHETAHHLRNRGVQLALKELRSENVEVYGIGFHGEGDYMDGHATHYFMANDKEQLSKGLASVGAEVPIDVEFEISDNEQKAIDRLAAQLYREPATEADAPQHAGPNREEPREILDLSEGEDPGGGFRFDRLFVVLIICVASYLVIRKAIDRA